MDLHHRVTGLLHIACGALLVGGVLVVALFFSAAFGTPIAGEAGFGLFTSLGGVVGVPFIVLGLGQAIAAVALLRGSRLARGFVVFFGGLAMFMFPIGTALGIYTVWALLLHKPHAGTAR